METIKPHQPKQKLPRTLGKIIRTASVAAGILVWWSALGQQNPDPITIDPSWAKNQSPQALSQPKEPEKASPWEDLLSHEDITKIGIGTWWLGLFSLWYSRKKRRKRHEENDTDFFLESIGSNSHLTDQFGNDTAAPMEEIPDSEWPSLSEELSKVEDWELNEARLHHIYRRDIVAIGILIDSLNKKKGEEKWHQKKFKYYSFLLMLIATAQVNQSSWVNEGNHIKILLMSRRKLFFKKFFEEALQCTDADDAWIADLKSFGVSIDPENPLYNDTSQNRSTPE